MIFTLFLPPGAYLHGLTLRSPSTPSSEGALHINDASRRVRRVFRRANAPVDFCRNAARFLSCCDFRGRETTRHFRSARSTGSLVVSTAVSTNRQGVPTDDDRRHAVTAKAVRWNCAMSESRTAARLARVTTGIATGPAGIHAGGRGTNASMGSSRKCDIYSRT